MARQKDSFNDEDWPEVSRINNYAIFMGYLLMGVRGLGVLAFLWITVVLGGLFHMLQYKDFWYLTAIGLVQVAGGAFDFLLKEKASDVKNFLKGLVIAVYVAVVKPFKTIEEFEGTTTARLAYVLSFIQLLVIAIVLCPLAFLYMFGFYLSAGISIWRLIQHDYGNPDGVANLKRLLNVGYSLAVAQGVVYTYRAIYDVAARSGLVEGVAKKYSLESELVSEYLDETVAGCMKDPSFARGRNFVTYAVELLMESKSMYGYISGVLILGRIKDVGQRGQRGLLKKLLTGSVSFSHVVERLAATFGPESPYSTEIRVQASRIVTTIAGSIRLDHFPAQGKMMIQCISSLLDTFEEYSRQTEGHDEQERWSSQEAFQRRWLLDEHDFYYLLYTDKTPIVMTSYSKTQGYKALVVEGLSILQGLAVNEDNCRVISNTQGLLSKAISPLLVLDQLHRGGDYQHHVEWCSMAEESLELMRRLMATTPGEIETKLRNEISGVEGILACPRCRVLLKRQAVQVLLDLSVDAGGSGSSSSRMFVWILLHISLVPDLHFERMSGSAHFVNKSSDIKRLAGEKLHAMLSSQTSTLRSVGDVICSLATAVADTQNNNGTRIHAANILQLLVTYNIKDDEIRKQLKKAMTDVLMPEVLKQMVVHAWGKVLPAAGTDIEQGASSHDDDNNNGHESSSTHHQQMGEQHQVILQKVLVDLCLVCHDRVTFRDSTRQFDEIAAKICAGQGMPHKTFIELVREAKYKIL